MNYLLSPVEGEGRRPAGELLYGRAHREAGRETAASLVNWMAPLLPRRHGQRAGPDKNDAAAIKAMKAFIDEGLQGLKAKVEAK